MIIGGSDLVPHKRRPGQDDDDDDDGQEAEPDGDAAFLLSNGKSGAAAKEKQNGGVSRETFASPQAGQVGIFAFLSRFPQWLGRRGTNFPYLLL